MKTVPKQSYLNIVAELLRGKKSIHELIKDRRSVRNEIDELYKERERVIKEFHENMEHINAKLETSHQLYKIMYQVQQEKQNEQKQTKGSK